MRRKRGPPRPEDAEYEPRADQELDARFRLCLSTSRSPSADLDRELEIAGAAGFSCVELWAPAFEAYLARHPLIWLDMQIRQHGIHNVVVNGIELIGARGVQAEDALVRQALFLEHCTHLDTLGGGTIVLQPAIEQEDEKDSSAESVRALRAYADLAAPFEVTLAFEFRANSTVPDWETATDLVDRAARSNLRLAFSTHKWCASEIDPHKLDALESGLLALVHLDSRSDRPPQASSDPAQPPDKEEPDLAPGLCAHLAAVGFRGPYCLTPALEPGTPLERARAARQAASDLLAPLYAESQTS